MQTNIDQIWSENERRRDELMRKMVDKHRSLFEDLITEILGSKFVSTDVLDDECQVSKAKIISKFKQCFDDEEEELFAKDLNKVYLLIYLMLKLILPLFS